MLVYQRLFVLWTGHCEILQFFVKAKPSIPGQDFATIHSHVTRYPVNVDVTNWKDPPFLIAG